MRDYVMCDDCHCYTDDAWLDGYEDDGSPIYRCDACHEDWIEEHGYDDYPGDGFEE